VCFLDASVEEYENHFSERHVQHSNALHSVTSPEERTYLVGPLARINHCFDQLSPTARREAEACKIDWPCRNNFKSIIVRAVELIDAYEEALAIVRAYQAAPALDRVPFVPRPGEGCHATEAPRGLLYHRYRIGEDGLIAEAKIVPPTSQNLARIEEDLRAFLPGLPGQDTAGTAGGNGQDLSEERTARRCEHLIRNYDPCISCATHFLRLTIER
jgi:coenzyme F420-reducing hydrogenase alpha subunit